MTISQGEVQMNRFLSFVAAAALLGTSTITSACTSTARPDNQDFQYQRDSSINPACAGGFRPGNARSCSYWSTDGRHSFNASLLRLSNRRGASSCWTPLCKKTAVERLRRERRRAAAIGMVREPQAPPRITSSGHGWLDL